jgi:hypothetical protein
MFLYNTLQLIVIIKDTHLVFPRFLYKHNASCTIALQQRVCRKYLEAQLNYPK